MREAIRTLETLKIQPLLSFYAGGLKQQNNKNGSALTDARTGRILLQHRFKLISGKVDLILISVGRTRRECDVTPMPVSRQGRCDLAHAFLGPD